VIGWVGLGWLAGVGAGKGGGGSHLGEEIEFRFFSKRS